MPDENVLNKFLRPTLTGDNVYEGGGTNKMDILSELTSGTGVTVDGVLLKDGAVSADTINETTPGNGVVIDGVTLKDGGISGTLGKTDYKQFYGINDVVVNTVGTFAKTRVSKGLYTLLKSAADDTSIIGLDLLPLIRATALKGASLTSLAVIFENATADLDAHTATLSRITYADSVTEVVTDVPVTGTLGVGQDADPQVDILTVTTPSFETTALSKLVLELTVDAATTSVYAFVGVVASFTRLDI